MGVAQRQLITLLLQHLPRHYQLTTPASTRRRNPLWADAGFHCTILNRALRTRFHGFVAGLGVTALLQSSTATGLMVTGFAADGMVDLVPALGVMLGANVGTTLIVQVRSFDIAAVALALILIGVLLVRRNPMMRAKANFRRAGSPSRIDQAAPVSPLPERRAKSVSIATPPLPCGDPVAPTMGLRGCR